MATTTASPARRQSRLLDLLRAAAAASGAHRVGFLTHAGPPRPRALLIASIARADEAFITAAVEKGADALEVRVEEAADLRRLRVALESVQAPLGIAVPGTPSAAVVEAAREAGVDWIGIPFAASITALDWEQPARVLSVPFDLDLRLAGALSGLPLDAMRLVSLPEADISMSFAAGARLRAMADLLKKPILLQLPHAIAPDEAAACDHLGVDALVVAIDNSPDLQRLEAIGGRLRAAKNLP